MKAPNRSRFPARPIRAARLLTGHRRSVAGDTTLATLLAGIAGAANAGGFFALGQYTSHMTGYLSQLADHVALLNLKVAAISALAIAAFVSGAAFSTVLINWARQHDGRQQYALPLAVQGGLMACFAAGGLLTTEAGRLFALACLCFMMGMQNATITKLSGARIRTTHATGMITDIGIELGRAGFGLFHRRSGVAANGAKLRALLLLAFAFVAGGIIGAVGYGFMGFLFSLPLAALLLAISVPAMISRPPR